MLLGADEAAQQQEQIVIDFLRSGVADAYILGGAMISDAVCEAVSQCGCPVLALGNSRQRDNVITLSRDALPAYRDIWSRVPEAWQGKILYCGPEVSNTREKYAEVRRTAPAGMEVELFTWKQPFEHFGFNRAFAREGVRPHAEKLGKKKLLWCSSDQTALGISDVLAEKGLRAGKDYYLVGFDNIAAFDFYKADSFLASVDSHSEARGKKAAELVIRALAEPFCGTVDFPLSFVPRQSFPFRS